MLVIVTNNNGENSSLVFDVSHKENVEKYYASLVVDRKIRAYEVIIPN